MPRVRIELTTFRFLISDYETDALPTALTRHTWPFMIKFKFLTAITRQALQVDMSASFDQIREYDYLSMPQSNFEK